MVTKKQIPRLVPKRATVKQFEHVGKPIVTIQAIRKSQAQEQQYKESLKKSIENYLSSIPNLDELSRAGLRLIRDEISKIPAKFRTAFRDYVSNYVQERKRQQMNIISGLQESVNKWKKEELRADEKQRKYAKGSGLWIKYKTREAEMEERRNKAQEILERLKKGELLDRKLIFEYIAKSGKLEAKKTEAEVTGSLLKQKLRRITTKARNYIEKSVLANKVESLKAIKEKLGISTMDAYRVQKIIKDNIKPKEKKKDYDKLLDSFSPNIVPKLQLARFDIQKSYSPKYIEEKIENSIIRGGDELARFNLLSPQERNLVISYAIMRSARKFLPSSKELEELHKQNKLIDAIQQKVIIDRTALFPKDVIKFIKEKRDPNIKITQTDLNRIERLRLMSDRKIRDILKSGDMLKNKQLNDMLTSLSKFYKNQEANDKKLLRNLVKKYETKLKDRISLAKAYIPTISDVVYASILASLNEKLKKNGRITAKEYLEFSDQINDLLGFKKRAKKTIERIRANFGQKGIVGTIKGNLKTMYDLYKFTGKTTLKTLKYFWRDASALFKLFMRFGKMTINPLIEPFTDYVNYTASLIKRLPKSEREKLYDEMRHSMEKTLKTYKSGFVKAGKTVSGLYNLIRKHPETIGVGLALLIANGQKRVRHNIINNPDKVLAELLAYFLEMKAIEKGITYLGEGIKVANKKIRKMAFERKLKELERMEKLSKKPALVPTDFSVEAMEFYMKNPRHSTVLYDKSGNVLVTITKKGAQKTSKQLTLLAEKSFKDFMKPLTDPRIKKPLKSVTSFEPSKKVIKIVLSKSGEPELMMSVYKKGAMITQKSLLEYAKPNQYIIQQGKGAIKVWLKPSKETKLLDSILKMFSSKKAQQRLVLLKKMKKMVKRKRDLFKVLEDKAKMIDDGVKILNKSNMPYAMKIRLVKALMVLTKSFRELKQVLKKLIEHPELIEKIKATPSMKALLRQKAKLKKKAKAKLKIKQKAKQKLKKIALKKKAILKKRAILKKKAVQKKKRVLLLKKVAIAKQKAKLKKAMKKKLNLKRATKLKAQQKLKALRELKTERLKTLREKVKVKKKTMVKKPKIQLRWDRKPPKNKTYLTNVVVRVRGKNKEFELKTTPNRALRWIIKKVDNTTARSFQLKIVGLTTKKDVKRPSLAKFRKRIGKDRRVLIFVEKTKYAIDTRGEKKGLKIARLLKQKR